MAKGKTVKRGTGSAKPSAESTEKKGWPDVAYRLIDVLYDLVQTGNLIAILLIAVLIILFVVALRLPDDALAGTVSGIGAFFAKERYYILPLSALLLFSFFTNVIQARVYRAHIQDLTEHRKVLVHGLETGELKRLANHTSSGFDVETSQLKHETSSVKPKTNSPEKRNDDV
ncbi:MAG: hypothetical protein K9L70_02575 [Thiohalocapsa sp.]|nr:hypothetical protein [Thiohalocapsa sp.]MCF7990065.1 hypothetical protein [Thiohalocapsa sp.]